MNWIHQLLQSYNEITRTNPLVATLALPVVGGIMFYLKDLPKKLFDLFVAYTTVTMTLNNTGWDGNIDAYNMFDKWFMQSGYAKWSRSFFMFRQYKDDMFSDETVYKPYRMGAGRGTHIFFYKRKLFWFEKGNLDSGGSEKQKEEITIRTFGWKQNVFYDLVDLFNEKKGGSDDVFIHKFNFSDKSWEQVGKVPVRSIDTFCMDSGLKAEIIGKIEDFFNRREWYRKKGLTYKMTDLFYGPPGTGKTTLCKLLAAHFKRDLYVLDLSQQTNESLIDALSKIKPGSFLLMEDVDQAGNAVRDRKKKKDLAEIVMDMGGLTMSGMLNAFDGVVGLDNLVILMTTNHPEDLDEAIKRDGRVDNEYLIGELGSKEIFQYMQQMYELNDEMRQIWCVPFMAYNMTLPGCEVENAFKNYPEDPRGFIDDVAERVSTRLKLAA
jgi:hypothetical protein